MVVEWAVDTMSTAYQFPNLDVYYRVQQSVVYTVQAADTIISSYTTIRENTPYIGTYVVREEFSYKHMSLR